MKIIILLSLFLFSTVIMVNAQDVSLKGKVQDEDSGDPLEFANVALLDKADSSVVTGGMSNISGQFDFVA